MTPQSVDPYSFFPDSIIPFKGQEYLLESLIDEPELDYFELGRLIANLPFLADCGFDDSQGITRFLKSVDWGKSLEDHYNKIKDLDYLDSGTSSTGALLAKEILVRQKSNEGLQEKKHEHMLNLAMLETAYSEYFQGYKTFLRGLISDYEENKDRLGGSGGSQDSEWSDLEQALWNRSELFWASCMAEVQKSTSKARDIGWWFDPDRTVLLSLGNSWFAILDRDEESYQIVPPTSDLLTQIGFYAGEDCVWFRGFEQCEIEHNHDESRTLFIDVPAPTIK